MTQISAVVITLNEERNIERCLKSLQNVVDEIVVFDSFSTDRTVEICKSYGAKVTSCEWKGYAQTKNEANEAASHNYILWLDADEQLSEQLKNNILKAKDQLRGAYTFNRLNNYYGKWIKHGGHYPDRRVRLFNRNDAKWVGDYVHETLKVDQGVQASHIPGDLLHFTSASITEHINQVNKFTDLAAQELFDKRKKVTPFFLFSPLVRFIRDYFLKLGFLDGYHGLVVCIISAHAKFLKYAKLRMHYLNQSNSR